MTIFRTSTLVALLCSSACITVQVTPTAAPTALDTHVAVAKRTNTELRALMRSIDSYSIDYNKYPGAGAPTLNVGSYHFSPFSTLEASLLPAYNPRVPTTDYWGNAYLYWSSPDGQHYALLCLGATGHLHREAELEGLLTRLIHPRFG